MNGLKDLFASERGVFSIVLVVCATVLLALDKLTSDQWLVFTGGIAGALITSKTVTGVAEIKSNRPALAGTSSTTVLVDNSPAGGS